MSGQSAGLAEKHQNKRAANSRSLLPWLVPSPRYFAKIKLQQLLVERQKSLASSLRADRRARGLHANHGIFKRAEAADASLVQGHRNRRCVVNASRRTAGAGRVKRVAALGAGTQNAVEQARCGRAWCARGDP